MLTKRQSSCLYHMGIPYWRLRTAGIDRQQPLYVANPEGDIQLVWTRLPESDAEKEVTQDLALIVAKSMPNWCQISPQTAKGLVVIGQTTADQLAAQMDNQSNLVQFSHGQWYTVIPEPQTMHNEPQLKLQAWSQIIDIIKTCDSGD